ncbi:MAG: hypothetical protein WC807_20845 [Hyphomicrobium sp.]|jgi:hypothetical protein
MANNESHPLFRKDEALIDEFNTWYVRSAQTLSNVAKKREMLEYLDNANSMARNVKLQIIDELNELDQTKTAKASYDTKRDWIMGRYANVNDRLWDRRSQLGTQLDTMLNRLNSKTERGRERMPTHIVAAAKTSPEQQKAASAFDRLMEPRQSAPATGFAPRSNQEQERA